MKTNLLGFHIEVTHNRLASLNIHHVDRRAALEYPEFTTTSPTRVKLMRIKAVLQLQPGTSMADAKAWVEAQNWGDQVPSEQDDSDSRSEYYGSRQEERWGLDEPPDEKREAEIALVNRLRARHQCPIWRGKDGSLHPISLMSPGHLTNALRQLYRRLAKIASARMFYHDPFWGPHGDGAQDAAERAMDEADEIEYQVGLWATALEGELERRGLPLPERVKAEPPPRVKNVWVEGAFTIAEIDREKE